MNVKLVVHRVTTVLKFVAGLCLLRVAPRLAARKSVACDVRCQAAAADQQAGWRLAALVSSQEHPSRSSVRSNVLLTQSDAQTALVVCSDFSKENTKIRMDVLCELLNDAVNC